MEGACRAQARPHHRRVTAPPDDTLPVRLEAPPRCWARLRGPEPEPAAVGGLWVGTGLGQERRLLAGGQALTLAS